MRPASRLGPRASLALLLILGAPSSRSLADDPTVSILIATPDDFGPPPSELAAAIERYADDARTLARSLGPSDSPSRRGRLQGFDAGWLDALSRRDFDAMSQDGRVDYLLLKNHLESSIRERDIEAKRLEEEAPLLPFAATIIGLEESRRRMEPVDSPGAAATLTDLVKQVEATRKAIEAGQKSGEAADGLRVEKSVAFRAAETASRLRNNLNRWFGFYHEYEPVFTWWVAEPHKAADRALQDYARFLREKVVGIKPDDKETIVGDPIGREALLAALKSEMVPYTPEELIAIAEEEFAWCEERMKEASRDLDCGDDWKKALEHVKGLHVEPGKQPALIRDLANEAIQFLDDRDLVTIPPLARQSWRMEMMSPQRQLVNPFFTGGEVISVSYPTSTMTHEQKLMSMRGNNIHFSRATVHHELIPGHHLQHFMAARHRAYRRPFETPFLVEGWALYWEMVLWDKDFPKSAEDRVGMLFWRMHRCARILFSLGFHLGKMTPRECIDLLVDRVGHERDNATAEVRRSFNGSYPPLYQCAYMLGALQLRALRRELVDPGKMTERQFHDAVLKENAIPVEMIRASLTGQELHRDFETSWKFAGEVEPEE